MCKEYFPEYMIEYIQSIGIFVKHLEVVSVFMEIVSYYTERKDGWERRREHCILEVDAGLIESRYNCPRQI